MSKKIVISALLSVAAALSLVGCSKDAAKVEKEKAAALASMNTLKVEPLPSVYADEKYSTFALATDGATRALVAQALSTQDVAKLTPYIKAFIESRDAMLIQIPDQQLRLSAFKDVMQKNLKTKDERTAYAEAMTAYHKEKGGATGQVTTLKPVQYSVSSASAERHPDAVAPSN